MNKLSEKEILDYLMTSEFEEGLTPDEFKFLLKKYRYYYRLSIGKNDQLINEVNTLKKLKDEGDKVYFNNIEILNNDKIRLTKCVDRMKKRNLTWKERFSGKIIDKENETK